VCTTPEWVEDRLSKVGGYKYPVLALYATLLATYERIRRVKPGCD